jgi:PIN domain nuclease of toxin-antitoxin system
MKYLLDTHIWLWSLLEPDKLDANVVKVLENKGYTQKVSTRK